MPARPVPARSAALADEATSAMAPSGALNATRYGTIAQNATKINA